MKKLHHFVVPVKSTQVPITSAYLLLTPHLKESMLAGIDHSLGSIAQPKVAEQPCQVVFDCSFFPL